MTVEVAVDDRGRVTAVEVVAVRPPSPFDEVFVEAARRTLRTWRYAPRYEGGQPVASRLRWTLEFFGRQQTGGRRSGSDWWESLLGRPRRRGDSLLELPDEQRERLLEEALHRGVEALDPARRKLVGSDRFRVYCETGEETATIIHRNLLATYGALEVLLGRDVPRQPAPFAVHVLVFEDQAGVARLRGAVWETEVSSDGFYSPLGLIGFHLRLPTPADALELLIHEATHAYMDGHVLKPGVLLPRWLGEGLASYVANSTIKDGKLIPGRVPLARRRYARIAQGGLAVTRAEPQAALDLGEVKLAIRRGEALTLAEMMDADEEAFYGERLRLYYGMSWLLVHFLRHGQADWAESSFPDFLLFAGEGFPVSAAFEAAYGGPPEALEEAFQDYVKGS